MTKHNLQNRRMLRLVDLLSHAFLLFRQQVEFALPFGERMGGVGVTNLLRPGGVCVTFFFEVMKRDWLLNNAMYRIIVNAKGMFTNLIETKAGLSPECLKENLNKEESRKDRRLAIANFTTKKDWENLFLLLLNDFVRTVPRGIRTAN